MPVRRPLRAWRAVLPALLALAAGRSAPRRPRRGPPTDYEMPFPCGAGAGTGSTRSSHSPSVYSIDWNRTDDLDDPVVASGAGVVTRVENLGSSSYGLYVDRRPRRR